MSLLPPHHPRGELSLLSRRRFLLAAGAAAWSLSLLPTSSHARLTLDTHALNVHEVSVPVRDLPRALEGCTIAHLTDTHLREIGALEEQVIAAVQARNPEIVVLTGDMLSYRKRLPILAQFCHALAAPGRRVFAIRGNHEGWSDISARELRRTYQRTGVRLLVNEHVVLHSGLAFVGTEDSVTKRYNLSAAVRGLPTAIPVRIHLSHAPEVFDWTSGPAVPFALCLAGHTHGGQIRLPFVPPYVPEGAGPRFVAGWYETTRMGPAYVSRGIGTTAIPIRLNCPPELPFFRLTRA